MNLTEMRSLVRKDMHDENSGNYRWTDDELNRHITHAVTEFSEAIPLQQKATLTTTGGSREVSLTTLSGRVMIEAVEYPLAQYPAAYPRFSLWGDTLTLLGDEIPDGSNCSIFYGKLHTLDSGCSTIPSVYEDLIACGACGFAAIEWALEAINKINSGGPDTPIKLSTWGETKLNYFRAELKSMGRRNTVRVSQLYVPNVPAQSQSTDPGS